MRSALALVLSLLVFVPASFRPATAASRSVKDDGGYAAWLGQLRDAVAAFDRSEGSDEEEQVRQVLLAKPPGGAASYPAWLALYGTYLDKLDTSQVAAKILDYLAQGRPAQLTEQYGPWLDALAPRLEAYNQWVRPEQLTAIQKMGSVAPQGTDTFYQRWLALYDKYVQLYHQWGRPETKTVLDWLVKVKPAGGGGEAPAWLREPEQSAEQVTADPLFVDRYLDLTVLIKQKLAYQAANGDSRAREQLDRLRRIAE